MAYPSEDEDVLRDINQFRYYRGQTEWEKPDFDNNFRRRNYQYPNQPVVAVPPFPGWQALASPPADPDLGQAKEDFLEQTIPEITADPAHRTRWKGIKYLGGGGGGRVGLWDYTGPEETAPSFRRVAVKELPEDVPNGASLEDEGFRLERLRKGAQSLHIITLQVPPRAVNAEAAGLVALPQGIVRRLVFEYCDMGDLQGLIETRLTSRKPLKETSLWQIFNCLVDGLSVLEFGAEHSFKPNSNTADVTPVSGWEKFIHFDLKPPNILLKDDRFTHSITPLCKVADFGLSKTVKDFDESKKLEEDLLRYEWRTKTTPGYFAPEQFTEQWEYANWEELGIAGNYGPAMNVWGMGVIMYQLVRLDPYPIDIRQPYTPVFKNGEIAKGIAFGIGLRSYPYSQHLLDLISECLYEHPDHRPTVAQLKERVKDGFNAAVWADAETEPWADFMPAPPPPPPPAPPVPPLAPAPAGNANNVNVNANNNANGGGVQNAAAPVGKIQCQFILKNGERCRNTFNPAGARIYCHVNTHRKPRKR